MRLYKAGRLARLRAETEVRQTEYRALTADEKIARLDGRLGDGVGAVKERLRILSQFKSPAPEVVAKKQKLGK